MKVKSNLDNEENMAIGTKIITNVQDILDRETVWNNFVDSTDNPLLYSRIFVGFMEFYRKKGWTPLIVTFWSNNRIIGVAPLKIKPSFYSNQISSLRDDVYTGFVFLDKYREKCISLLVDLIFNEFKCKIASLTVNTNSPNLKLFEDECSKKKLTITKKPEFGRAIIPLDANYDLFYSGLKTNIKKEFRRVKRRLDELGPWEITSGPINLENIKTIIEIDKKSWKENWREQTKQNEDYMLRLFLESSLPIGCVRPVYESEVWFLVVNGKAIAHQVVFTHKDLAILLKTSFDEDFRKFSVGKVLMNFVIRKIYKKGLIKRIDFVTNLPIVKTWKAICEPRTLVTVDVNPFLSRMFGIITQNQIIQKIGFKLKL